MQNKIFTTLLLLILSAHLFSQDFYDLNTIETIEITFEESNWDVILDTYYSNDNDEKLLGSAVINGVAFDSIGVKYKGNSTYSANNRKNPLHIYLDYMIDGQDYEGYESIKLSNGKNDPSFVREVLSYEIARKYMKAPLSNYAKVYINGNYYGLFSNSEAINGDFTERRLFSDNDNTRIKCNPQNTFNGNGPSLEYLGTDSSAYYNYYEVKSDYGWQNLIDLTYDIEYNANNIEDILDIDHAIWMMAFNNVLVNLDSYLGAFRQNYYLIKDDNDKFIPVTWDLNESFGGFEMIDSNNGGGGGGPGGGRPTANSTENSSLAELDPFLRKGDSTYPLLKMIFENERYSKMYIAHCQTMLNENFVSGWYMEKADSLQDLIADDLSDDPNAFYSSYQFTGNLNSTQDNTVGISQLMESRITYLQNQTVFNYTQPTITNITAPDNISPYTEVCITAEITNANYAHIAYRYSKDDSFDKIEMYDDGEHGDGVAYDNIYGASFMVDESNTHYYIYAENNDAGIFSPQRAEHEYYKLKAVAAIEENSDMVINELMASNTTCMADENGEFDDWIELYNNTNTDISLSGYYLTDNNEDLMQWAFPDTVIAANSYLIVWADKDEEQKGLHASFKLSASGEDVYLVNSEYTIVNSASFGEQTEDMGYARVPNATGDFVIQDPTFSAANNESLSLDNNELNIDEGNSISISTSLLSASDQITANSNIVFTINTQPTYGKLENSSNIGTIVSSFTEQDLIDGKISYTHDGSNTTSDSFTFSVSNGTSEITGQVFNIVINAIDDDVPTIISNEGLTTNEGANIIITTSVLLATDTEVDDENLQFTITTAPINGQLEYNENAGSAISSFTQADINTGKLSYVHNGTNTSSDSFTFTVSDGTNQLTDQLFSIVISPIDEDAPTMVTNTGAILDEGASFTLSTTELMATDFDTDDAILQYTIKQNTANGVIESTKNTGVAINTFTQQDLIDKTIQYTHNGSNTTFDSFNFSVSDGANELNNQSFTFSITSVDDDHPIISTNTGITLDEGTTLTLSEKVLLATDTEADDATLTYNITTSTTNGILELSNNPGISVSTFTQKNLIDKAIRYTHNGSNTTSDSFVFTISDGINELANQTVAISINPIDDDAPTLTTNVGLVAQQGLNATITADALWATDTEAHDVSLIYTLTKQTEHGIITHNKNQGVAISTFTQQDINDNLIQYEHDGTNTSTDDFTFEISDGTNQLPGQTFSIYIMLNTSAASIQLAEEHVTIYPNPSSSYFNIETESEIVNGEMYSIDGRKMDIELEKQNNQQAFIDVTNLQSGVYLIKTQTETKIHVNRVIIR